MIKKLGIYHRILAVIIFTSIVFVLLLTILFLFKNKQEKLIFNASQEQYSNEVKSLIGINSERLKQIVFDYTYWDEFVQHINKKDTAWFDGNISSIVNSYHFYYVCVYDSSFNKVYESFAVSSKNIDIVPKGTLQLLKKRRIDYYFHHSQNELFEVSCASIHPTKDPTHKLTKPRGYLFLAKKWDKNFLDELSILTASEIKVKPISEPIKNENYSALHTIFQLKDWNSQHIANVIFTRNSKTFKLYDNLSVYMFLILLLFVFIALLAFHFTTRRWISYPLNLVTGILAENKTELIIKLENGPGEFKQIGKLIKEFVDQKIELEIAKERAEESDRLKSAFLANMSHEIRTPMNGILGFANLLKEPMLTGEQQQQYIRIIEKSGERMLNIINDLINISKVESGQMKVSLSETNINEQLEYIHVFFNHEAASKNIKLLVKTGIPSNKSYIQTDKEKLYAILTNLVKNALKFTDNGSIEFGYTPEDENGKPILRFYVKDTGIGIKIEKQAVIFNRFIQADLDNKRAFQGAGLGLAITKAYVELLGGKIWLESIPEKGTQFYFQIPYIPIDSNVNTIEAKYTDFKIIDLKNKLKILIVDDEEIVDIYLTMIVKEISKEILHAKDGVEAMEVFTKNPQIDLILMDIQMPKMNGYEATRLIRTINKKVIILVQTAYALANDRQSAFEAGCSDYITKPVKKDELIEMIQLHINKGRLNGDIII